MDAFCDSIMGIKFDCHSVSVPSERNLGNGYGLGNRCTDVLGASNVDAAPAENDTSTPWPPRDSFDGVLRYLNQMLMEEEDLGQMPCMYQDCLALQAAEKSFYDALVGKDNHNSSTNRSSTIVVGKNAGNPESKSLTSGPSESFQVQGPAGGDLRSCDPSCYFNENLRDSVVSSNSSLQVLDSSGISNSQRIGEQSAIGGRVHPREFEDDGHVEERSAKQLASHAEELQPEEMEMYDKVLLCSSMNPGFYSDSSSCQPDSTPKNGGRSSQQISLPEEPKRGRPRAGDKKPTIREVVDLRGLLIQCAESVASYDNGTAYELLNRIRRHSSPYGDATERLAHCFSNALEARISGMGTALYTAFNRKRVSAAESLKAYQSYILASPFQRISNAFAVKSIGRLTKEANTIHIIDFGILYGFQWPCLIQGVSLRPGGPPKIRITGIELPQPGFRPASRVEETGLRLARYCKRFGVPFEYHAVAKKWETIRLEDLKIDESETIVVNCLNRLRHIPDETAETSSPRDAVLNLIRKINPDLFVHGVLNGSYNAPFFVTRFREALHHFSSLFDMFDKTLPREDQDRFLLEKELLGKELMNVIACEGTERVERPETYKQWQVRNRRAGFRQLPLMQEIVKEVRATAKLDYHKDFLVDEDCNWMLQGWKGRIIYALSCWKPIYV